MTCTNALADTRTYDPLEDIVGAYRYVESGGFGNVVITVRTD